MVSFTLQGVLPCEWRLPLLVLVGGDGYGVNIHCSGDVGCWRWQSSQRRRQRCNSKVGRRKEISRSPGMSSSDDVSGSRKWQWRVVWWLSVGLQLAAVAQRRRQWWRQHNSVTAAAWWRRRRQVAMAVVSWCNRNMKFLRKFVSQICRNTRKIGKNGDKKVKLNGLIHSKTVLVEDHV